MCVASNKLLFYNEKLMIPVDLLHIICSFLSNATLYACLQVCKDWNDVAVKYLCAPTSTIFKICCEKKHIESIKSLIENYPQCVPVEYVNGLMYRCVRRNDVDLLRVLLKEKRANPFQKREACMENQGRALCSLEITSNIQIVEMLVKDFRFRPVHSTPFLMLYNVID